MSTYYIPGMGSQIDTDEAGMGPQDEAKMLTDLSNSGQRFFTNKDDAKSYQDAIHLSTIKNMTGEQTSPDEIFDNFQKGQSSQGSATPIDTTPQPSKTESLIKNAAANNGLYDFSKVPKTGAETLDTLKKLGLSTMGEMNENLAGVPDLMNATGGTVMDYIKGKTNGKTWEDFVKNYNESKKTNEDAANLQPDGGKIIGATLPLIAGTELTEPLTAGMGVIKKAISKGGILSATNAALKGKTDTMLPDALLGAGGSVAADAAGGVGNYLKKIFPQNIYEKIFPLSQSEQIEKARGSDTAGFAGEANENNAVGSNKKMLKTAVQDGDALNSQIDGRIANIKDPIDPAYRAAEIRKAGVERYPDGLDQASLEKGRAPFENKALDIETGKDVSAKDAQNLKKTYYQKDERAYADDAGIPKSDKVAMDVADARGIRMALEAKDPELGALNKKLGYNLEMQDRASSGAVKEAKKALIPYGHFIEGALTSNITGPVYAGIGTAGREAAGSSAVTTRVAQAAKKIAPVFTKGSDALKQLIPFITGANSSNQ